MSVHFNLIDLRQGTSEWREWRHQGIGASEAPIIMGESRFKSTSQLLQEKLGPVRNFQPNAAMARGIALEPEARRRYITRTGKAVMPMCLQSTRHDWMRASLDGFSSDGDRVVEIKCGQAAYRNAAKFRSVSRDYYGQVQQIMAVTNLQSLDFFCYWPGCPEVLIPVQRDNAYIDRLLKKGAEFWNAVQSPALKRRHWPK